MKSAVFLRIASVFTFIHCVAHTIRGVLAGPTHGADEIAVIETMQSRAFNFAGSSRTYWDFHLGYGLFLTIILLVQACLFWYLAGLVKTSTRSVRFILVLFAVNYLGLAIVAWGYFSLGPAIIELLIAVCLATAFALAVPTTSPS